MCKVSLLNYLFCTTTTEIGNLRRKAADLLIWPTDIERSEMVDPR